MVKELPRLQTGIKGFDSLLGKGIPRGSSLLVEGGPGSGKTIFTLQLGYHAVQNGDKVLYMSFEEQPDRLVHHMESFGWDVEAFMEEEYEIRRYNALDISRSVEALLSEAKRELLIEVKPMLFPKDFKPTIVVVDSLTSIASAFSGEPARFRIYMEQFFKYLEKEDITSFLIRETPIPTHIGAVTNAPGGGAVSFLSDGIISIYNAVNSTGERQRAIEIVKMRSENFKSGIVQMDIVDKKGIQVHPKKRLSEEYTLT